MTSLLVRFSQLYPPTAVNSNSLSMITSAEFLYIYVDMEEAASTYLYLSHRDTIDLLQKLGSRQSFGQLLQILFSFCPVLSSACRVAASTEERRNE